MMIWLPRWPVQRRLLERPELRKRPLFVCRRQGRGVMTVASWAWAEPPRGDGERRGAARRIAITPGMSLAESMAVLALAHGSRSCHLAEIDADDPAADRLALERLARWCRRFSPSVGLEAVTAAGEAAESIQLDVTGTAAFFGGESLLVRTAVWTLAARGLHARAAVADTPGSAWAASHSLPGPDRRRWVVVPCGESASRLAGLPAATLRLDAATLALLREVGIETIGGVLRLSPKSLASRFPPLLALRLAQFSGGRAEPPDAIGDEDLPHVSHAFDVPVPFDAAHGPMIEGVIERLVAACVAPLAARGAGVLALQVRLETAAVDPLATAAPLVIDVGVFRPSAAVRHLVELVRLRMARMRLEREVGGIAVEVVAAGAVACRQRGLFADTDDAGRGEQLGRLLDRLAGRLGRAAVFEPQPVADAQPEHAWLATPPGSVRRPAGVRGAAAGRRPLWMPPRPVRLEPVRGTGMALLPEWAAAAGAPPVRFRCGDRLHHVVQAHGPERIETAWWRGATVRRDYYVVETEAGGRYWIFRRIRDGGWFLHGMFA